MVNMQRSRKCNIRAHLKRIFFFIGDTYNNCNVWLFDDMVYVILYTMYFLIRCILLYNYYILMLFYVF